MSKMNSLTKYNVLVNIQLKKEKKTYIWISYNAKDMDNIR